MDKMIEKVKSLLNKDVTSFLNKNKIPLTSVVILVILTCLGLFITYAYYQAVDITPVVGASVGQIADLDVRIMAEERDANGNGLGTYAVYPYIPRAGYRYNETKSKCANGSSLVYDGTKYEATINAQGHDLCYLYFDSTAALDLTLKVYAQNIDDSGQGIPESYTELITSALPSVGYKLNTTMSHCENGSTIGYSYEENLFAIEATQKDVCYAYMDAIDVDIATKIYVQVKKNKDQYVEVKKIPNDAFYELNESKSSCTGTSTLSVVNQRVVTAATSKTYCVAHLDISTGPVLKSMEVVPSGTNVTVKVRTSSIGTAPLDYYYSSDGGMTYVTSKNESYTFKNLTPSSKSVFKAYYVDADGKTSNIFTIDATTEESDLYVYNGVFDYSNAAQEETIEHTGYYRVQAWGAQGGNAGSYAGGKGAYATGIVHLIKNDKLYINTGGQGADSSSASGSLGSPVQYAGGYNGGGATQSLGSSTYGGSGGGATDVRLNQDSLHARLLVAGGGGGASSSAVGGVGGGSNVSTTFGLGSEGSTVSNTSTPGGGGGWYGGTSGYGGSSWIYTADNFNSWKTSFSDDAANWLITDSRNKPDATYYIASGSTSLGSQSFESTSGTTETGHEGNGYVKVTYIGSTLP